MAVRIGRGQRIKEERVGRSAFPTSEHNLVFDPVTGQYVPLDVAAVVTDCGVVARHMDTDGFIYPVLVG